MSQLRPCLNPCRNRRHSNHGLWRLPRAPAKLLLRHQANTRSTEEGWRQSPAFFFINRHLCSLSHSFSPALVTLCLCENERHDPYAAIIRAMPAVWRCCWPPLFAAFRRPAHRPTRRSQAFRHRSRRSEETARCHYRSASLKQLLISSSFRYRDGGSRIDLTASLATHSVASL